MKRSPFILLAGLALLAAGCSKKQSDPGAGGSSASGSPSSPASGADPAAAPSSGETARVELSTSMGTIKLELYPQKAPKTVTNFLRYVRAGHYSGTIFHRVIGNFMIQGGGFDNRFQEKPTEAPIQNEADNGLSNARGTVAMARTSDPHSASAQFYINVVDNRSLDHREKSPRGWGYTVFGKVVEGMEVVDRIKAVATGAKGPFPTDVPLTDVVINEAKVIR